MMYQENSDNFKLLSGMALLFQSCNLEAELFDVTDTYLPRLFPDFHGEIFLQDGPEDALYSVVQWGRSSVPERERPAPDFTRCRACRRGEMVTDQGPMAKECDGCGREGACFPLCEGNRVFGLLYLEREDADGPGQRKSWGFAFVTAEYLALAISNLRLRHQLHELTIKDPLTGLFNRRHLDDIIHREVARAQRDRRQLGMIMVDLDHFKRVNDTFGHDAGDVVLGQVAGALTASFRVEDVVCRFGGEEFFVLMTRGGTEDFMSRARQVRARIKALDITWQHRRVGPVTASLGVAVYPDHGDTFETVLGMADQALYLAKSRGRDQVVLAQATAAAAG